MKIQVGCLLVLFYLLGSVVASCRTSCTSDECLLAPCSASSPFLCVSTTPGRGECSVGPWPLTLECTSCCDFRSCLLDCDVPCTQTQCDSCIAPSVTVCSAGSIVGQCSNGVSWSPAGGCAACCNASECHNGPAPPLTNPPILTPAPGWTESPTTFAPPTPLPMTPPATPTPSGQCPPCSAEQCPGTDGNNLCTQLIPFLCLEGQASGECLETPWESGACAKCCDYLDCLPSPPAPYPSSPWLLVPPSDNCSSDAALFLGPNPSATPYGGIDVSGLGCRASVSEDCCGVVPRFNWVLAACHSDPAKRISMACNHTYGNTSVAEIYYISAYQWNRDSNSWVMDPSSSFAAQTPGDVLDFETLNLTLMTPSDRQDWDLKYGPTTANQGTSGLGPPAMMFVLSAKQLNWIAFFALNQISSNRGPGGERFPDNCWSSSAGEFDFLEAPFWAGINLPSHHLYATITSGTGRCLPVQKMVSSHFNRECSDPHCCQMCSCPLGYVCVGDPRLVGYETMSCILANETIPPGMVAFEIDGDPTACGAYFSAVPGGSQSTSFFANETASSTHEIIVVAVVDSDGVTVYRWPSSDESSGNSVWPGIRKFGSDASVQRNSASSIQPSPPCSDVDNVCSVHLPSCDDDCVIDSAFGQFGSSQLSGSYSAECARDGLNWWTIFDSTEQTGSMRSSQLPMFVHVPTTPIPPPFHCNTTCPPNVCHSAQRCNISMPFMCTSGDELNLCTDVPSQFPWSGHCNACCDIQSCEIQCQQQCSLSICATMACDTQAQPFFCSSGPLQGACSATSASFSQQPACYTCCNAANC
ncbi:Hypothetical protein, putative [Bodo saltans]|uniref:Membrane-associated protein n=1 Tax=Bodo saltans TaxID=75058 RepID=A0A0S4JG25_BODSA|nr:Hypothetical protein, putative [Bodo saltans]|eukprot:CUG89091.1 Hypothetical protein, putative [Bodo saltans]